MKKFLIASFFLLFSIYSICATVDTVSIYSNAMHLSKKCVVVIPQHDVKKKVTFPVVYLLHGYSGDYSNWISKVPQIKNFADAFQLILVCPDGDFSSWYFDSPVDPSMRYETYIAREVPAYIEAHYPTINNRNARAITGLSMGGHGGLFLGFRHSDYFGACGSMSGGVDLSTLKTRFDVPKRVGDTIQHAADWTNLSVMHVVESYPKDSLAIIFDCGTQDFFYTINRQLHEKMLQLHIPHDYIERPGEHNWDYWGNAVEYQLLFFRNYFSKFRNASGSY